jgi:hypothetical protein
MMEDYYRMHLVFAAVDRAAVDCADRVYAGLALAQEHRTTRITCMTPNLPTNLFPKLHMSTGPGEQSILFPPRLIQQYIVDQ